MIQGLFSFADPPSDWTPPEVLPDLSAASYIAIDTETRDPYLTTKGPGGIRGDAYVVGIAVATDIGHSLYLPIKHQGGGNLDPGLVKRWAQKEFSRPNQPKVFANALYDLELLKTSLDVDVAGKIYDVQVAEPLIDENQRSYSLERISRHYLGEGKNEGLLQQALSAYFPKSEAHKGSLWRLHSKHVGPYAQDDAIQTLRVFMLQLEELRRQNLEQVFDLETRVVPCLFYMRMLGTPVDIPRAERSLKELQLREAELQKTLNRAVGLKINVWAANSLKAAYDEKGIQYPRLVTGNASFTQEWLSVQTDELSTMVLEVRKLNRMWSTFVKNQVLDTHVRERVHCQFHGSRSDDGGTVTGRFSSSSPNLQQVPSPDRDKKLAVFARGLFIPEEGSSWHCNDFSQVEPRTQLHYALLRNVPGAAKALEMVVNGGLDFHDMAAELTGLTRSQVKPIGLGISYGMGIAKLANELKVTEPEAREILKQYHERMPWLKAIVGEVTRRAEDTGVITTLFGRKRRFESWEPGGFGRQGQALPTREAALQAYGSPVRRAFTHKSFNALVQGGAADIIKKVMVDVFESGVLNEGAALHLTVHDELDFSVDKGRPDTAKKIVEIMQNAVQLRVPLKVDNEVGPSWGEVVKG